MEYLVEAWAGCQWETVKRCATKEEAMEWARTVNESAGHAEARVSNTERVLRHVGGYRRG